MSVDRLMLVLVLCMAAIELPGTIGGNPTDRTNLGSRNGSTPATGDKNNTLPCQEDMLDQCPLNSSCDKGKCQCLLGFKLNPAHQGKTTPSLVSSPSAASTASTKATSADYCLVDESSLHHTGTTGSGDDPKSSHKPSADGSSMDSSHAGQLPLREPPAAHHILGGVLIPLAFVVILIGSAILAKRAQLWSRLRQRFLAHRNRHRRRPAYEDVVLVGFEPQAGGL